MLQDIVKLTQFTVVNALEDTTIKLDLQALYDVHRAMQRVILAMHVLEVHYLHLPLNSVCLQGSSLGTPFEKWCLITAKDFDEVRKSMRAYLLELANIYFSMAYEENYVPDKTTLILEKFFRSAIILGFFSYHYESGKLSNDGLSIVCKKLIFNKKKYYEDTSVDIETYEKRLALCQKMKASGLKMQKILDKTKAFLMANATLKDLL